MSEQISVQVAAPGAAEAAKSMDAAATAAENLAHQEKLLASLNNHLAGSTKAMVTQEAAWAQQIKQATDAIEKRGVATRKASAALVEARNEAKKYAEQEAAHGGGGHGKGQGAAYWMSRAAPGHEMQIMNASSALAPMLGAAALPAMGVAAVALGGLAIAATISARAIEHRNHLEMENLKVTQDMAKAQRDALWAQQNRGAGALASMRKNARFILSNDPEGEDVLNRMNKEGAGAEGISSMASVLKNRGMKFGRGHNAWTANQIYSEAKNVARNTGMEVNDVLQGMNSSQGAYRRDFFEAELTGRTYSREEKAKMVDQGGHSRYAPSLNTSLAFEQAGNRFKTGEAFDLNKTAPAMAREYEDLTDPMKRVVREHNEALTREIDQRGLILLQERTWWEAVKEHWDPKGRLWGSKASDARKEIDVLSAQRR